MKKLKKIDVLKNKKINYQELSNDIKCEVAILGGLDIFTDAHVRGVTDITTKICEDLNMDYERLKHMVVGAYLHDVGKIMVPKEVLQKTGKLTAEEYNMIQTHTTQGYDICMKYKELRQYAPIARWHHESFDGSGYPDKLKGNQIPFEASLIKVADVYDALIRKRQYKDSFKPSDAVRIMIEEVKSQRMSGKILLHLVKYLIYELHEKSTMTEKNMEEYQNNIDTLHDIEKIYKEIYDRGYNAKVEKKLKKYELTPGYDMSANANLLTVKQKSLEKEKEEFQFLQQEENELQTLYDELYQFAKTEDWYPEEPYYR